MISTPTSPGSSTTASSNPPGSSIKKTKSSKGIIKKNQSPSFISSTSTESSKKSKPSKTTATPSPPLPTQPTAARASKTCKIVGAATAAVILGGSAFLTWKYALGSPTSASDALEGLDDFKNVLKDGLDGIDFGKLFNNDSKEGDTNLYIWKSEYIQPGNGGLHLTLLNALDDTWQEEFWEAVSDWQESPALTLDAERVDVDYDCNRISGVMVICNANFGETGWVGINENEIKDGVIVSSVTKMNEYYLRNAEYAHRRYTMCHEIGHGFGLPHTDEDPINENLGNCLDYTVDPAANLYPGNVNYKKLAGMYLSRRMLRWVEGNNRHVIETHMLVLD
ncbi:hypothetical protein HJC23_009004 [Cyclotella cryptica]|uniref:Peptidase M10 metallopeptidase domain-containing protein n=1 Tax=Cyclotella cryptica TaxID=29204 RepID=A0ABD3QZ35_9STRA